MAAYIIAEIEVTDPAAYEGYRPLAAAAVQQYGGKFLVRGGAVTPKEGGWKPERVVVLEFASMAALERFYDSPEYQKALPVRLNASRSKAVFVEGA